MSAMTLEEFRRCLLSPAARKALGFDLADEEAAAIVADEIVLVALYVERYGVRPMVTEPPRIRTVPLAEHLDSAIVAPVASTTQATSGYATTVPRAVSQFAPPRKFWEAVSVVFSKYADFTGVASRSEYWYFWLFIVMIALPLRIIAELFYAADALALGVLFGVLTALVGLAIVVPHLAVLVRRLRHAGYHWAYLFLFFVPVIGAIFVIVLLASAPPTPNSAVEAPTHPKQQAGNAPGTAAPPARQAPRQSNASNLVTPTAVAVRTGREAPPPRAAASRLTERNGSRFSGAVVTAAVVGAGVLTTVIILSIIWSGNASSERGNLWDDVTFQDSDNDSALVEELCADECWVWSLESSVECDFAQIEVSIYREDNTFVRTAPVSRQLRPGIVESIHIPVMAGYEELAEIDRISCR